MEPRDFCYWLKGRAELVKKKPTKEEWSLILEHLDLVFTKETKGTLKNPLTDEQMQEIVDKLTKEKQREPSRSGLPKSLLSDDNLYC